MFAQLGNHIFQGIKLPNSWNESHAQKYGQIPLINRKNALQAVGEELVEISLSVRYSIDFSQPQTEIEALKESQRQALQLPFITGEGKIIGVFVITDLSIKNESFSPTGILQAATVDLSLLEAADAEQPKTQGTALTSSNPVPQPPAKPDVSPAKSITNDIGEAKSKISQMKQTAADVKKGIKSVKRAVREIRKLSDSVKQLYSTVKTKVIATQKIIQRAGQLPTSLDGAIAYAENLASLDNITDTTVLEKNVSEMSNRADNVSASASAVAAFSASKEGGN